MGQLNTITGRYQLDGLRQKYLLRKINKIAQTRYAALLGEVLDASSEALIAAAEGVDGETQRRYFDALCRLYGKRDALIGDFTNHFSTHFYAAVNRCSAQEEGLVQPLVLPEGIEQGQFEVLLAELERSGGDPQQQIRQQLQMILGCEIPSGENPLCFQQILAVFQDSLSSLDAPPQVNQLYYRMLAKPLISQTTAILLEIVDYIEGELSDLGASEEGPASQGRGKEVDCVSQLIQHLQQNLPINSAKMLEERVAKAVSRVDVVVKGLLDGVVLHEPVASLLVGPWKSLMVAILVEEGEQSLRWQVCQTVTQELIMSIQPPSSPQQRQLLLKNIPKLVKLLKVNLQDIHWIKIDQQKLFVELEQLHLQQLCRSKNIV